MRYLLKSVVKNYDEYFQQTLITREFVSNGLTQNPNVISSMDVGLFIDSVVLGVVSRLHGVVYLRKVLLKPEPELMTHHMLYNSSL